MATLATATEHIDNALFSSATSAMDITVTSSLNPSPLLVFGMAAALCAGGLLSLPAKAETWTFSPRVQVSGTHTDNVALAGSGQERADTILELSPGIRIQGDGARVKLNLDYAWQSLTHLNESNTNSSYNMLNASANVEAIEKWFYLDATAGITQQNISAFGPQAVDNTSITGNRTTVSSYSFSPYIKGPLGAVANYELRHNTFGSYSGMSVLSSNQTNEWVGMLRGTAPLALINWGFDYNRRSTDYTNNTSADSESYRGSLYFNVDPQLMFSANAGFERNNVLFGKQSGTTHGFGFRWTPEEWTSLVGERDQRLFGPSYSLLFNHRMPMSALDIALTRDLTSTPTVLFTGMGTTLAQLLANSLPAPPAGTADNRLAAATSLLGASANLVPTIGFLTNQIVLQRRLQASYALIGSTNMLTLSAFRSDTQAAAPGFSTVTDITNLGQIVQTGQTVNWSHTISGLTSLMTSYAHVRSTSDGSAAQTSLQNILSLNLSTQLSPKTSASFGLRHVSFAGSPTDYRENAVFTTLIFLF